MTNVIETSGLTKRFADGRGVRNINLRIPQGQVFGFLGPNGAGKSTVVKMLVGLLKPTSGEARVLGLPLGNLAARRRIGYVPELFRYQDWLTAQEVLRFHAGLCRMKPASRERRIEEVLRAVDLLARKHDRVKRFSKGMQQRLGIACALLSEPELLLLDEPASALDPGGRHDVRVLLERLTNQGMTVFLNTHMLEDVETICTDVALLIDGSIRTQGSVREILHPEPIWEFYVGGWEAAFKPLLMERMNGITYELHMTPTDDIGITRLEVCLGNEEHAAWLNAQLVGLGISVYRVHPRQNKLESWFLALTESLGRGVQ